MSNSDFTATENLLGTSKAGLSNDLDALAAYVTSLNQTERSPYRSGEGGLTASGLAGKAVFADSGCSGCHSGNTFTDSAFGVTHDIGTLTAASGPFTALDTPTLKGLWSSAPYLHDDAEREVAYGPADGLPDTHVGTFSQALMDTAEASGWTIIRMKDDWKTIFAGEIQKAK
jgi:cytochrome c peroxidase